MSVSRPSRGASVRTKVRGAGEEVGDDVVGEADTEAEGGEEEDILGRWYNKRRAAACSEREHARRRMKYRRRRKSAPKTPPLSPFLVKCDLQGLSAA